MQQARLKWVQSKAVVDGIYQTYRYYVLRYNTGPLTGHSRLESLTECGSDRTCLSPTTFTWQGDKTFTNASMDPEHVFDTFLCKDDHNCDFDNNNTVSWVDINDDGKADMCYRSDEGIRCYESGPAGLNLTISTELCKNYTPCWDNYKTIQFFDFNHDGRIDLLFNDKKYLHLHLGTAVGFADTAERSRSVAPLKIVRRSPRASS